MKKSILSLFLCCLCVLCLCSCTAAADSFTDNVAAESIGNYITNLNGMQYGMLAGADGNIYYQCYITDENGERFSGLCQNTSDGTERNLLFEDCGGMINVIGKKIYFRNYDFDQLLSYDLQSGKVESLLSGYFIQYVLVYQDIIYFIHMDFGNQRQCTLYQCDLNGNNLKMCAQDIIPYYLDVFDERLFYIKYEETTGKETLYAYDGTAESMIYRWNYTEEISVKVLKNSFIMASKTEIQVLDYDGKILDCIKTEEGTTFASIAYNGKLYYLVNDTESGYKTAYQYQNEKKESGKIGSVDYGLLFVDTDDLYSCGINGEIQRIDTSEERAARITIESFR